MNGMGGGGVMDEQGWEIRSQRGAAGIVVIKDGTNAVDKKGD